MTHLQLVKGQSGVFTAKCSEHQAASSNAGMKEGVSKTSEPMDRNLMRVKHLFRLRNILRRKNER
jgi:hypothetical protein